MSDIYAENHQNDPPDFPAAPAGMPVCRECGCWDLAACVGDFVGPCWWVEPDLCSHCWVGWVDKESDVAGGAYGGDPHAMLKDREARLAAVRVGEKLGATPPGRRIVPRPSPEGVRTGFGTYDKPEHGWTCFHCGVTFTSTNKARDHFGHDVAATPACQVPAEHVAGELRRYRYIEARPARASGPALSPPGNDQRNAVRLRASRRGEAVQPLSAAYRNRAAT